MPPSIPHANESPTGNGIRWIGPLHGAYSAARPPTLLSLLEGTIDPANFYDGEGGLVIAEVENSFLLEIHL